MAVSGGGCLMAYIQPVGTLRGDIPSEWSCFFDHFNIFLELF